MPTWLRLVGNFFKTFWWVIVLVLAVIAFVVGGFILVNRKKKSGAYDTTSESFVKTVTNKVASAVTDIKVEKAVISTKSDMKRKELEEIRKEPDGKKRRDQLAKILQQSL